MTKQEMSRLELKQLIEESLGRERRDVERESEEKTQLALRKMLEDSKIQRQQAAQTGPDPIGGVILALAVGNGDPMRAERYAEKRWGSGNEVAKALAAGTDTAGGFLVPEVLSPEMIGMLNAQAVMRRMGCRVMPLVNGQLTIPRQTGGATAAYLSEGANIAPSQQTFGQINLQGHKLAALVAISNDLLEFAAVNADQIVRQDLVTRMALREDLAFIEGNGDAATPVGLRNMMLAANAIVMTATPTAVTATTDGLRMITLLDNGNVPDTRRGWIMRPSVRNWLAGVREATGALAFPTVSSSNTWLGYPIAVSTQITIDAAGPPTQSYVYLAEFPELIIGDAMTLRIDASDTAAYDVTGTVTAAFSRDETVIRCISMHDFGMRHSGAACALTGCTWGGA